MQTCDIVVGCSFVAHNYIAMWSYGWHFWVHHADEWRTTCDSCIACRFKLELDGSEVDYVGIIEKILEVDFRSFKTLLLKVQWFHNTAWLEDCLFYSIDTSKFFGDGRMSDQPFVLPNEVEQVFLAKDRLNPKRNSVLQDNPKCHIIFEKLLKAPKAWTSVKWLAFLLVIEPPNPHHPMKSLNVQKKKM